MPTGQVIISNALTALGLLDQGGTPSLSDSIDALNELNSLWDAWQIDDGLIYEVRFFEGLCVVSQFSYPIGTGAQFNTPRPNRVFQAVMYVVTSLDRNLRKVLKLVNAQEYFAHSDLGATATISDELYYDFNVDAQGYGAIYTWPQPSCQVQTFIELELGVPFTTWQLGANYLLPYGYQDALEYALAWRLLPRFGMAVSQQTAETIEALGQKSEARIRAANSANRQIPPQQAQAPGTPQPQQVGAPQR